jgi:methylmalonyl-CoA/ethylmalonyl-CoA epimerase
MSFAVHGLNIAVKDLPAATRRFEQLFGVTGTHVEGSGFAFPGLEGTRFDIGGFVVNLITSDVPGTSVYRFLEREGEGLFLLSTKVDDIAGATDELSAMGITPVLDEAARGSFGAVNFVHPRDLNGVQLEVLELP